MSAVLELDPDVGTGRRTRPRLPFGRVVLLLPAGLALLSGLDAALMLIGLPAPVSLQRLPQVHGMLLVLGFVGTLVALERAVALRRRPGYAAPLLLAAGTLALLSPAPLIVGRALDVAGTLALVAVYVPLWRRQRDDAVLVQAMGAVLALGAAILWLGGLAVPTLLPWLVGFVVLTILGERLELARLATGPRLAARTTFGAAVLLVAVVASLLWPPVGVPAVGAVLVGLVTAVAPRDVARRTVRSRGLPRYAAVCMLAGYAWLGVAGGIWLLRGPSADGPGYDAVIHAVFLGFTISMIMAHAPVILPAVLRRPLPYRPALFVPALLLHVALVVRLWLGDALAVPRAWQWGSAGTIAALLLFVLVTAWCAVSSREPGPSGIAR